MKLWFILAFLFAFSFTIEAKKSEGSSNKKNRNSKPSPSRPSPSYSSPSSHWSPSSHSSSSSHSSPSWGSSYSQPAHSTNYGWNVGASAPAPKPVGNTNYGWNTNSGAPSSYSPSYSNSPSYSAHNPSYPSYHNSQPAYNPGYTHNGQPAYNPSYSANHNSGSNSHYYPTHRTSYSGNSGTPQSYAYGNSFGPSGLGQNTYIYQNDYGKSSGSKSGFGSFLTSALFSSGSSRRRHSHRRRKWDKKDERRWRETTKAPYFENKVPGSESYLPAAAVIGAATAFGLVSLLPLNVPAYKPLMYCNATEFIAQSPIQFGDNIYSCSESKSILISCPRTLENSTIVDECAMENQTMKCEIVDAMSSLSCTNATLISSKSVVCNSTSELKSRNSDNETSLILHCLPGNLLPHQSAAAIPTTTTPRTFTPKPPKKALSFNAEVHIFFLRLIGKGDLLDTTTARPTTTTLSPNEKIWIPEPMTLPIETTTATPLTDSTSTNETTINVDIENEYFDVLAEKD